MRYFIELAYLGKNYHGWQRQPNAITVQQKIEEALGTLLRTPIEVVGAGRTDAGVHARQLYAHFDCAHPFNSADLVHRLNAFLPGDIAVKQILNVASNAHARFDALARSYEYWVVRQKNPFYRGFAHLVHHPLDFKAMDRAAKLMMAYNDFECFSKTNTDVKTFLCAIDNAFWQVDDEKAVFHITADRFLRNMVRAIVGTLLQIGIGKRPAEWMQQVVESKDRGMAGASVPAKGLYLTKVGYPKTIFL